MDDDASVHTAMPLDNSGRGPLQVPGFQGIPVHYELNSEDCFAHGERKWRQAPAVTARELAMVVMNKLVDKPEWYVDIFNDQVVAKWREEAFEMISLMSEKAWSWIWMSWIIAVYFREKQYVCVLDTGSCVCKSETLALQSLAASFRSTATPILDQQQNKDWQLGSDNQVLKPCRSVIIPFGLWEKPSFGRRGQVDWKSRGILTKIGFKHGVSVDL